MIPGRGSGVGLHALAGRLEAAGYPVEWDDALAPQRHFYSIDPFGNRLEFLEPVPTL